MSHERKIINDPVFGFINIPKGLLYDVVRHPLLQRLNRIKQLGLSSVVYPGAQHTRFQHSLGAFYLMSETIQQLATKGNFIFDSEARSCGSSHPDARHRSRSFLPCTGKYHRARRFTRRHLLDADGTHQQGDERTADTRHSNLQGRISQTLPAPTGKRATGYGPPGLPAPRQFLYRSDRRQHWLRPHHQDAGCKGRPSGGRVQRHLTPSKTSSPPVA